MADATVKLTKKAVEAVEPVPGREVFAWDSQVKGFGLRVYPTGRRVYLVQYRDRDGRTRRVVIGQHGSPWTADEAREDAKVKLLAAAKGQDPAHERDARRRAPTVAEAAARYLAEHAEIKKKPRSLAEDKRIIETKIVPHLGTLKLRSLTRRDVLDWQTKLGNGKVQTNRALAVLSKLCRLAETWELRPAGSNPCHGVPRARESKRARLLSAADLARLGNALTAHEKRYPSAVLLFRLLILTGCRLREVMTADWSAVDLPGKVLHLADSKTGPRDVSLNAPAAALLAAVPAADRKGPLIRGEGRAALVNPYKAWAAVCTAAKLADLRIHDLRHAFASSGAAAGDGLPIIAALLGQAQLSTTERYSHTPADPVRAAGERIGERLWSALHAPVENEEKTEAASRVVAIRRRGRG